MASNRLVAVSLNIVLNVFSPFAIYAWRASRIIALFGVILMMIVDVLGAAAFGCML